MFTFLASPQRRAPQRCSPQHLSPQRRSPQPPLAARRSPRAPQRCRAERRAASAAAQCRASVPMYLLSRKIKAMGVKMVMSGEGADETYGGYLYFHKAPNAVEFHKELVGSAAGFRSAAGFCSAGFRSAGFRSARVRSAARFGSVAGSRRRLPSPARIAGLASALQARAGVAPRLGANASLLGETHLRVPY